MRTRTNIASKGKRRKDHVMDLRPQQRIEPVPRHGHRDLDAFLAWQEACPYPHCSDPDSEDGHCRCL